jgi:hypothetical protein
MQRRTVNILLAIFGVCALLVIAVIGAGIWFATSIVDSQTTDEKTALAAMDQARARFKGAKPVFEMRDTGPALMREVPAAAAAADLHTLHIINWEPENGSLARIEFPFSLLRLKKGPIDLASSNIDGFKVSRGSIRVDDLERFGPALLVDEELDDGHRLLVWTD